MSKQSDWYKGAVFYQIYPRSFYDTTGTGVGDLKGIIKKLDYVASLGVDAIWICPFFTSPMKDFGYDVADYRDIDPLFGSLDDFRKLLDKSHRLGLKVIIDQIISHTSEEHPWFKESRRDRKNHKKDWYVWEDPRECGMPPNNWMARFGGPAWTYSIRRGQYYMHNFYASQPNLNLHNPDVQAAVLAAMEFWLRMGVDGFRMDAISFYMHDKKLRDNPASPEGTRTEGLHFTDPYTMQKHKYDRAAPETLEFLKKIRKLMDRYPGAMTIGEASGDDAANTMESAAEYTANNKLLHTAYSHSLIGGDELTPAFVRNFVEFYDSLPEDSWPSWAFSNHDVIRAITRFRKGKEPCELFAKMLIALLCSLRGTPFLYQGEELGLPEATIPYEKLQDHWGIFLYPEWQGRDGARTPMPWRDEINAGFSATDETWLPIPDEHRERSVEVQSGNKESVLEMCRSFLPWRKNKDCIKTGSLEFIDTVDMVLAFWRVKEDQKILCCFNMSEEEKTFKLPIAGNLEEVSHNALLDNGTITLSKFGYAFIE